MLATIIQVTPDGLVVSWGAIGTMVAVSTGVCSAFLAYLRVFVGQKLSAHEAASTRALAAQDLKLAALKGDLVREIQESSRQSFLGRHVGEIVDARFAGLEKRLERLEAHG
jgi:hypothetical protein